MQTSQCLVLKWLTCLGIIHVFGQATAALAVCSGTELKFGSQTLTVPHGFTIDRAAGPPLVHRPITFDFDEMGHLYVAESSGTNDPVAKQLAEKPHRILRLQDSDGDGVFDHRTVYAEALMLPQGTMWLDGSLYVSAPPSIWKLTDTDDDGVADVREEWFQGKTLTGCANDLHGPYRGREGWIYWCKGAFAEQQYDLPNRPGWKTRASHIFRCRPDGSGLEPVMTGGMDNPVDVVFTPVGERILSCTFLQNPSGGQRDGLIHALYGGVYGKQHGVLDEHWRTGELLPALTQLGPAAPCGLHYYESRSLGYDFEGTLFTCQFNLHKVSRHRLLPRAASFSTEDSDFLTSDSTDFHPTDVIEDADGSLLVCDTGGWYKLCCPTSQLHKPDVPGAIYRIRRVSAPKVKDPRGEQIAWAATSAKQLVPLLDDNRPVVRQRAIEKLANLPTESLEALQELPGGASTRMRLNAVWVLSRIHSPLARNLIRGALGDSDASVRQAAAHAVSVWRDVDAVQPLCKLLADDHLAVVRAAAEALGRLGDAAACGPLLAAAQADDDRMLEHSITYALMEIGDAAHVRPGLTAADPRMRRAAVIALEQIPGGGLEIDDVMPLLTAKHPHIRDAGWWVAERHAEWGEAISKSIHDRLKALATDDAPVQADVTGQAGADAEALAAALARLADSEAVRALIARVVADETLSREARRCGLQAMALARVKPLPKTWIDALVQVINNGAAGNQSLSSDAVQALRSLSTSDEQRATLRPALLGIASTDAQPVDLRLAALDSLQNRLGALDGRLFSFLTELLDDLKPPLQRVMAAKVLTQASLSSEQQMVVAQSIGRLGSLEITRLLPTFDDSDQTLQAEVLRSLQTSSNLGSVRRDVIVTFIDKLPQSLQAHGRPLMAQLDTSVAAQRAHLEELAGALKGGHVRSGHLVFNSKKAACITCHAMGYVGGQLGPDLSRIGQIRTERDLLEAIVYPSASFVRSYETVAVTTDSGKEFSGLLREETQQEVVLSTAPQVQQRIGRDEIEHIRPGQLSLMPTGYDKLLTQQELADLIAYLRNAR